MERIGHIIKGTSALLTVVIFLFSIGVPVIVASCPMAKPTQGAVCDRCPSVPRSGELTIGKYSDRSCCSTVFAAGRNTTEYLVLSQLSVNPDFHAEALQPHIVVSVDVARPLSVNLHSTPSPPCADIPLFVSALLI